MPPGRVLRVVNAVLSRRALNRATLERQLLLSRSTMPIADAVDHLVGVQAQTPHSWYTSLWSRLEGFDPEAVGDLLERRALVRVALMRSTLHLVTAKDVAGLRSWVQPVLDRDLFHNQAHGAAIAGVDVDALVAAGRAALAGGALTNKDLGTILAGRWPDVPPATLVYGVRNQVPLVQVPPRGVWGRSGAIAHTTAETWLGEQPATTLDAGRVIHRYLAAFGPASVRDLQQWSGLTRLAQVMESLRAGLRTFRDDDGLELFDLPDAALPDEATPAPPRFLSEFDNVLLSYADRSRVTTGTYWRPDYRKRRPAPQYVLVDGFTAGDWVVGVGQTGARLTVHPYGRPFADGDAAAITSEGLSLLRFLAPGAEAHEVEFGEPR